MLLEQRGLWQSPQPGGTLYMTAHGEVEDRGTGDMVGGSVDIGHHGSWIGKLGVGWGV